MIPWADPVLAIESDPQQSQIHFPVLAAGPNVADVVGNSLSPTGTPVSVSSFAAAVLGGNSIRKAGRWVQHGFPQGHANCARGAK